MLTHESCGISAGRRASHRDGLSKDVYSLTSTIVTPQSCGWRVFTLTVLVGPPWISFPNRLPCDGIPHMVPIRPCGNRVGRGGVLELPHDHHGDRSPEGPGTPHSRHPLNSFRISTRSSSHGTASPAQSNRAEAADRYRGDKAKVRG